MDFTQHPIVTAWLAAGAFSDTYLSTTSGQSWKEIDSPSLVINDIIFDSEKSGIATRISPGMFTVTPVSKSTAPSRNSALSLSSFFKKRSRTPGASASTRAISAGPKFLQIHRWFSAQKFSRYV
jgi:hypothetical protein